MMRSWNLQCSLPKALPVDLVYDLLIRTLERKINSLEGGMVQFSYCSMAPANCLLGQHCTCLTQKASEGGGLLRLSLSFYRLNNTISAYGSFISCIPWAGELR